MCNYYEISDVNPDNPKEAISDVNINNVNHVNVGIKHSVLLSARVWPPGSMIQILQINPDGKVSKSDGESGHVEEAVIYQGPRFVSTNVSLKKKY